MSIISDAAKWRLTGEETLALFREIKKIGDKRDTSDLKNRILLGNLGLVGYACKPYLKCEGLDTDDVLQNGILGLRRAIDKFEVEKDLQFSTYAFYWIRQKARRYLDNEKLDRVRSNSTSMSKPIGDDEDSATVEEMIADPKSDVVVASAECSSLREVIHNAMKTMLTERERQIVKCRFGLDMPLEEEDSEEALLKKVRDNFAHVGFKKEK